MKIAMADHDDAPLRCVEVTAEPLDLHLRRCWRFLFAPNSLAKSNPRSLHRAPMSLTSSSSSW
eukprot:9032467-Pyramimonas_sp.AAC.1